MRISDPLFCPAPGNARLDRPFRNAIIIFMSAKLLKAIEARCSAPQDYDRETLFGLLLDYWNIAFGKTLPQAQTCKDLEGGATRQFVSSDPDERAIAFLTTAFANQYLFSIKKNPGIFASPPARHLHCSDQVANFRARKDEIKALSRAMGLRCYIHAGKSLTA